MPVDPEDRRKMRIKTVALLVVSTLFALPALAQNDNSEVSAGFTANFPQQATGLGLTDSPTNAGGLMINYRYHFNGSSAIEVSYARTRFTQFYTLASSTTFNSITTATLNEATLAYVHTFRKPAHARYKPFLEAGTGALIFRPTAQTITVGDLIQDRSTLLYGGGVDWKVTKRMSLRLGYRGFVYKAPDFAIASQVTNALTHLAEPYVGIVYRF
jgi:opacity protein-like surface antigen